ncbi:MAG: hypothetical protein ACYTGN_02145 [Planctomycetota bacterium]|jgi:ABC-type transport system involved in multi-copper enzyme maturation permease subunit
MTPALIRLTLRECFRRPLPYAIAGAVFLLALGSRTFLVFSFGTAQAEAINLAVSAAFLAGFLHAALQGTALLRADLERGTLGLMLTKPTSLPTYLLGRYLGLACASVLLAGAVLGLLALVFAALPADPSETGLGALFAPALRVALVILVLDAAALAASAAAPRVAAAIALPLLFLAGTLAGGLPLVPDFALFGLDVTAAPRWGTLLLYSAANTSLFLVIALILLASKQPLRSPR